MVKRDYEILNGITLDGETLTDGVIDLEENDETTQKFLDYKAIRLLPERKAARRAQSPGPNETGGDATQSLTLLEEAGRDELLAAGYDTNEKVAAATDDELLAVDGIGRKTLEKLRAALN